MHLYRADDDPEAFSDSDDDEPTPPLRTVLAHVFYGCIHRLRTLVLRWRLLKRRSKLLVCCFCCVFLPLFAFALGALIQALATGKNDSASPPPPPPPADSVTPQASGIWGTPRKGTVNVTELPFQTRPPGPPTPAPINKPQFTPPPRKNWLHVVMATMNRGVNGSGSTVLRSLQSIFRQQSREQIYEENIRFTIFNGNGALEKHPQLLDVQREFRAEFESGMMEIVQAPDYEQLRDPSKVQRTWNDSLERVLWRSKENLDFCFAMRHAAKFERFILFLEDDIRATTVWPQKLSTFFHNCDRINVTTHQPWMFVVLYFPHGGTDCIPFGWNCCTQAFVMKYHDIGDLCDFIEKSFDQNPIDWLLAWYRRKKRRTSLQVIPNLFQHWSTVSTLSEKANGTSHESLTWQEI